MLMFPRPTSRLRRFALATLALGTIGAATVSCRVPQRYDVTTYQGGLNTPWDLAFLPNGTMFVTERVGDIGVRLPDGTFRRFPRTDNVVAAGEGGMMGLAIDPGFANASTRRIYTCYLTTNDVRVVRFNVNSDLTSLSNRTNLVTGIPRTSGRHSGCRLAFGPDGALWVTTGDAARCENPQNLQSLAGKVLRIDTNGNAVSGNMTIGGALSKIYAFGFRNPQGITFRPSDGKPFIVEHGPDRDDEITPLAAGGNGGWAPGCGYNEGVPMTDYRLGSNVLRPFWQSGVPTIAPSGADFVTDADWGDRAGQLAVAVLKGRQLRLFNVTDGTTDGGGAVVETGERLRAAVEGPDGRLYVATDSDNGRIFAVQPVL
ncbi:MAG: PQQ-dependent sugar dehydrogenase [Ilumatobacteraceae bacterium]